MELLNKTIFRYEPPKRVRDRPMLVLALGLSRSGTDSLRAALLKLGYNGVYHGFIITSKQREDTAFWIPLMQQKFAGTLRSPPTARDFDSVLGDVQAVTDGPCNVFWQELIDAYPDAKVIVNRRNNMDAWFHSMKTTTIEMLEDRSYYYAAYFEPGLCALWLNFWLCLVEYAKGDFHRYGRETAEQHYRDLNRYLVSKQRAHLHWSVEDGWAPLCKFLGKDMPSEEFPNQNKGGGQFEKIMANGTRDLTSNAIRNMGVIGMVLVIILAASFIKKGLS